MMNYFIAKLKRFKIAYGIYNFFNKKKLLHNVPLYKKYGINKRYYSSVSSKDFKGINITSLTLNNVHNSENETYLNEENRIFFKENGFLQIKNFLDNKTVDAVNQEIDTLLTNQKINFRYGNKKLMFVIHQSALLKGIGENPKLMNTLSELVGGQVTLFQSINFINGSEQKAHSDSIHMTTFPLGGLLGAWIALEDIEAEQGALFYYPKSHKLPYYLNADYENEGSRFLIGDKDYTEYEKMIEQKIKENNLQKEVFLAKKGDLLVWHANLFHGGEPHTNKNKTRKSVVFHYYKNDCICYHEVTQRPALFSSI